MKHPSRSRHLAIFLAVLVIVSASSVVYIYSYTMDNSHVYTKAISIYSLHAPPVPELRQQRPSAVKRSKALLALTDRQSHAANPPANASQSNTTTSSPLAASTLLTLSRRVATQSATNTSSPPSHIAHTTTPSKPSSSTSTTIQRPAPAIHIASRSSPQCRMANCLDYLSPIEASKVQKCTRNTVKLFGYEAVQEGKCRFLPDSSRQAVALASPEGSGNTWLRGLLEKATGICTGFCCCDRQMRAQGFMGESVVGGKVLVVKTHLAVPQWIGAPRKLRWEGTYGSAVVLIRNPARALIAEWNRRMTLEAKKDLATADSHTNSVSNNKFSGDKWEAFSEKYLNSWIKRLDEWVFQNDAHRVHIVSYEDLQEDTVREVGKILDFLHYPYNHSELVERLSEDFTNFHRTHTHDDFQHYSPVQKKNLEDTLETVMTTAKACGKVELFRFQEYLQSLPDIN